MTAKNENIRGQEKEQRGEPAPDASLGNSGGGRGVGRREQETFKGSFRTEACKLHSGPENSREGARMDVTVGERRQGLVAGKVGPGTDWEPETRSKPPAFF